MLVVAVELIDVVVRHQTQLVEPVVEEEVVLDQDQDLQLIQAELTAQLTLVVAVVEENLYVLHQVHQANMVELV